MSSTTAVVPGGADAAPVRLALALSRLDGSRDLVVRLAEGGPRRLYCTSSTAASPMRIARNLSGCARGSTGAVMSRQA